MKSVACLSLFLFLVSTLPNPLLARPVDRTPELPRFQALASEEPVRPAAPGVFSSAQAGTTYFGGTVWAADSARWEAVVGGTWTFDSGVGSFLLQPQAGDPNLPEIPPYYEGTINPFKLPGFHGTMEGWTGIDNTFSAIPFFRNLSRNDSRWAPGPDGQIAVGTTAGLGGDWSYWCGALPAEADSLCYSAGQGYGQNWFVCIRHEFSYTGGVVTLSYNFYNETEAGYDYTYVIVDTTGAGDEAVAQTYTGVVDGTGPPESLTLVPGETLPSVPGAIVVKICVTSDGGYSDQDGGYPTVRGAFAVDDISVSGGGINHFADFEGGDDDGWTLQPPVPGAGGEWSDIVDMSALPPPLTDCECALYDSVLVFNAPMGNPHPLYQDNRAASPWMNLLRSGDAGRPGKFLEFTRYIDLPFLNFIFVEQVVQWYPDVCRSSGRIGTSPWVSPPVFYYPGPGGCTLPGSVSRIEFSSLIDLGAEQIRAAFGVVNYCRFYGACNGLTNASPYFDNVRFGVYGTAGAPTLGSTMVNHPQDAFPADGTLQIGSPARFDINYVKAPNPTPEPGSAIGDTLVVQSAATNIEVYVQFMIDPGPGINQSKLAGWLAKFHDEGNGWYSARMDTAEQGGYRSSGAWMGAFHEDDPGFVGRDTDLGPDGGLANDMFDDDLFTPGTRINLFHKARNVGSSAWYTFPDTTGLYMMRTPDSPNTGTSPGIGAFREWEALPSSMAADETFNCVLYVDHFSGRLAQPFLEAALGNILTGGSDNFENTGWDRYDVEAPSSQQASFGRPIGCTFGASPFQAFAYKVILWNSGNLDAADLTKEDGDILLPWLNRTDPNLNGNNLYLSGDGIASSITNEGASEPSARTLLENYCGVILECPAFRDAGCPSGSATSGVDCVNLDPVGGARVANHPGRTIGARAQGNGCVASRRFDVLRANTDPLFGTAVGDEYYDDGAGKVANYAAITNDTNVGGVIYRTVVDGVSPHYRRDMGSPCAFAFGSHPVSVEERLNEVLSWFGFTGAATPCIAPWNGVGIADPPIGETFRTGLASFAPNPLMGGATGRIRFTMARDGQAKVTIFDINGRLVKTVYDGPARQGENEATWDATDSSGRRAASGVYFIRMSTLGEQFRTKLVLLGNGGGR